MPKGMEGDTIPSGYRSGGVQQYNPQQSQFYEQLLNMLGPDSYLARLAGGEEGIFDEMEAPAWRQHQEDQGQLASRFSGSNGAMSARRGSGFHNMANQQSSDFAMGLQSQRQQLQQKAIQDLMGMGSDLLDKRPFEKFVTPKRQKQNPWGEVAGLFGDLPKNFANIFSGRGGG